MKKILFFIHDLEHGGAEKVLVNLVNNMDKTKFDITVMTLFDVGINKQFLSPEITYKTCFKKVFRGNSHLMKLFTPEQLHKMFIKEKYDIEVAYLEGPCARIISGCPNKEIKLVSWIHIQQKSAKAAASSFRNIKEATRCYNRFNKIACVSNDVKETFENALNINVPITVCYNTNESEKIIELSKEEVEENLFKEYEIKLIGVGKLLKSKGFDRLVRITKKLSDEGYPVHLYILGIGPLQEELEKYIVEHSLEDKITLLGYKTNPYKYVAKSDLFVCASFAEGFSTAATESLIVGTPVCTVEVAGMKEMLGEKNEYGVVVHNDEESLYKALKNLLDYPETMEYYKEQALKRGQIFTTEKTVKAVEKLFMALYKVEEKNG